MSCRLGYSSIQTCSQIISRNTDLWSADGGQPMVEGLSTLSGGPRARSRSCSPAGLYTYIVQAFLHHISCPPPPLPPFRVVCSHPLSLLLPVHPTACRSIVLYGICQISDRQLLICDAALAVSATSTGRHFDAVWFVRGTSGRNRYQYSSIPRCDNYTIFLHQLVTPSSPSTMSSSHGR